MIEQQVDVVVLVTDIEPVLPTDKSEAPTEFEQEPFPVPDELGFQFALLERFGEGQKVEKEVFLTNAYFVPDPQLLDVLKQAAARGVDVRLLLSSKTDSDLVFQAGRGYYTEVLEAGIRVYERQKAVLHAKTALIESVWSTVGSTNLDWRSFLHNAELNAVVLGADFGNQMHAMFERDLEDSRELLLEEWEQRPLTLGLKEMLARIWQYWL